jgi:hypothetical protein
MNTYDNDIREFYADKMPAHIKELIALLKRDLQWGPLYLDEDGEPCSPFDEGATLFSFDQGCAELREWADEAVDPLYMEPWCGYWQTEKPDHDGPLGYEEDEDGNEVLFLEQVEAPEYVFMDVPEIRRILFGELSSYL